MDLLSSIEVRSRLTFTYPVGDLPHYAKPITSGQRINLVIWCRANLPFPCTERFYDRYREYLSHIHDKKSTAFDVPSLERWKKQQKVSVLSLIIAVWQSLITADASHAQRTIALTHAWSVDKSLSC